jgi:hypothetical protein
VTIEELKEENDTLRGICAYENIECLYCGLPRAEMARCQSGFPGCARTDDMLCAPASIQAKYEPTLLRIRKE